MADTPPRILVTIADGRVTVFTNRPATVQIADLQGIGPDVSVIGKGMPSEVHPEHELDALVETCQRLLSMRPSNDD